MPGEVKRAVKGACVFHIALLLFTVAFVLLAFLSRDFGAMRLGECAVRNGLRLYCPGCGGTRAVIALCTGHPLLAFRLYPPLLAALLAIAWCDGALALAVLKKSASPLRFIRWQLFLIPVALSLVNAVLYNVLFYRFGVDALGDLTALYQVS